MHQTRNWAAPHRQPSTPVDVHNLISVISTPAEIINYILQSVRSGEQLVCFPWDMNHIYLSSSYLTCFIGQQSPPGNQQNANKN